MKLKIASLGIIVSFIVLIVTISNISKHMFDGITVGEAVIYCALLMFGILIGSGSYIVRRYYAKRMSQINDSAIAVKTLASIAAQQRVEKDESNNYKEKDSE